MSSLKTTSSVVSVTSTASLTPYGDNGLAVSFYQDDNYYPGVSPYGVNFPDGGSEIAFPTSSEVNVSSFAKLTSVPCRNNDLDLVQLSEYNVLNLVDPCAGMSVEFSAGAYSGECLDIDLFVAHFYEFYTGENTACELSISNNLESYIYAGEITSVTISPQPLFVIDSFSGQSSSFSLYTASPITFSLSANTGQSVNNELSTQTTISVVSYNGQNVNLSIEVPPIALLIVDALAGQETGIDLETYIQLQSDGYVGQSSTLDFTTFPSPNLELIEIGHGVILDVDILVNALFIIENYVGQSVEIDLEIIVNPGTIIENWSGQVLNDLDLSTATSFDSEARTGETSSVDAISTEAAIDADAYNGSFFEFEPTWADRWFPEFEFYDGAVGNVDINVSFVFFPVAYEGTYSVVDLTVAPSPGVDIDFYTGESSNTSLQVAQQLGTAVAYTGTTITIDEIDSVEPIFGYNGQDTWTNLNTSVIVAPDMFCGGRVDVNLDVHPSESFGDFNALCGETSECIVYLEHTALLELRCYEKYHVQVDMDSQTNFDLAPEECCSPRKTTGCEFDFELNHGPFPDQLLDHHYRVYTEVDLETKPHLELNFYAGEVAFDQAKVDIELELVPATGSQQTFIGEMDLFVPHRLCKGYFIPSGDNINVELTDVLDETCYVDKLYVGETMVEFDMMNSINFYPSMYTGQTIPRFNLVVPEIWVLLAWNGSSLRCELATTILLVPKDGCITGEVATVVFEEPDWNGYTGEFVEFNISTEVYVEFTESGCLDNEYVEYDEEGRIIEDLSYPIAVELVPFYHEIKTRCFR